MVYKNVLHNKSIIKITKSNDFNKRILRKIIVANLAHLKIADAI